MSVLSVLPSIPTIIVANKPPTKPPMCPKASIFGIAKLINKFRNQANKLIDSNNKYNIEYHVDNNNFSLKDNYRLDYFLSKRI